MEGPDYRAIDDYLDRKKAEFKKKITKRRGGTIWWLLYKVIKCVVSDLFPIFRVICIFFDP